MNTLSSKRVYNTSYYFASDVRDKYPAIFIGCKYDRTLVTKRELTEKDDYIYVKQKGSKWIRSDGNSKKFDKLMLSKSYVTSVIGDTLDTIYLVSIPDEEVCDVCKDLEVWGERTPDGCYFRVNDVSKCFGIKRLRDSITDKRFAYEHETHYRYFNVTLPVNHGTASIKKDLFLTYTGLLKVLFSSRSGDCEKFVNWASSILFAHQLGTPEQKVDTACKLIGATREEVNAVFSKCARTIPCVYLIILGRLKDLPIKSDKPGNYYVAKYGLIKDINRRMGEHTNNYFKEFGVTPTLECYAYIDPQYLSIAETNIRDYFETAGSELKHGKHTELVCIEPCKLKLIKRQYEVVSKAYSGHISELLAQLKAARSETEIVRLQCDAKLKDMELELLRSKYNKQLEKMKQ